MQVWVQSLFLFALVWSVGANTDEEGRTTFDHMLRKLLINDPPADLKPYIKVSLTVVHFLGYTHTTAAQEMSNIMPSLHVTVSLNLREEASALHAVPMQCMLTLCKYC